MNTEDLEFNVAHATQTLAAVKANVKAVLESDSPDSVKKTVLIEYLATYEVELEFLSNAVAKYITEATRNKKTWQFWK